MFDSDLQSIFCKHVKGSHDVYYCAQMTEKVLAAQFKALAEHHIYLEGAVLKPNMVKNGLAGPKASPETIATLTCQTLLRTVPPAMPGIFFLSGETALNEDNEEEATINLSTMNKLFAGKLPWHLSFSYGKALQKTCIVTWLGKTENKEAAQKALKARSNANSDAVFGKYKPGSCASVGTDGNVMQAAGPYWGSSLCASTGPQSSVTSRCFVQTSFQYITPRFQQTAWNFVVRPRLTIRPSIPSGAIGLAAEWISHLRRGVEPDSIGAESTRGKILRWPHSDDRNRQLADVSCRCQFNLPVLDSSRNLEFFQFFCLPEQLKVCLPALLKAWRWVWCSSFQSKDFDLFSWRSFLWGHTRPASLLKMLDTSTVLEVFREIKKRQ